MNFESVKKINTPEIREYSETAIPEKQVGIKIECPERQETVDQAIVGLETAFETLGIENWSLPEIKIKFTETEGEPILGRVEVHNGKAEILFDQAFSSPESEAALMEKLDKDYPGMLQTLKHELAHIAMWSVTGKDRQPATRLIDEGWATLLGNTGSELPIQQSKLAVRQGLIEETDLYNRCLDFKKRISYEEKLNTAEYEVGQALLLWINEKFGKEKMIGLVKDSLSSNVRFEDDNENIESEVDIKNEGERLEAALLEATGYQDANEIRQEFLKWVSL
jgi:hypothetical protein